MASYSTTKVTVASCRRYLTAYYSKGDNAANRQPYTDGNNLALIKSLVSQMEEIVGSGNSKSLNGPEAALLFAGSLFFE